MTVYQKFALDHFLSAYPDDGKFEDILESIDEGCDNDGKTEDEFVLISGPFEHTPPYELLRSISDMVGNLERTFPGAVATTA